METFTHRRIKPNVARGALAGLLGGIAGTLAMDAMSWAWSKARGQQDGAAAADESLIHQGGRPDVGHVKAHSRHLADGEGVATTAIAEKIAEPLLGRPLSRSEKHHGGQIVHYSYGALSGLAYGAGVEHLPALQAGDGSVFGFSIWAVAVEMAFPALKLSRPPGDYSPTQHTFSFGSHILYGVVTETTRRVVRSAIESSSRKRIQWDAVI